MSELDIALFLIGSLGFLGGIPLLTYLIDFIKFTEDTQGKDPKQFTRTETIRLYLLLLSGISIFILMARDYEEAETLLFFNAVVAFFWMVYSGRIFKR